mmetsp:Transcript_42069/g.127096  ORF Transcript_42069/g.127096 Transcript_42069/m.127096 type:complete len:271 (-) Transcript_42069:1184-1996(-)
MDLDVGAEDCVKPQENQGLFRRDDPAIDRCLNHSSGLDVNQNVKALHPPHGRIHLNVRDIMPMERCNASVALAKQHPLEVDDLHPFEAELRHNVWVVARFHRHDTGTLQALTQSQLQALAHPQERGIRNKEIIGEQEVEKGHMDVIHVKGMRAMSLLARRRMHCPRIFEARIMQRRGTRSPDRGRRLCSLINRLPDRHASANPRCSRPRLEGSARRVVSRKLRILRPHARQPCPVHVPHPEEVQHQECRAEKPRMTCQAKGGSEDEGEVR